MTILGRAIALLVLFAGSFSLAACAEDTGNLSIEGPTAPTASGPDQVVDAGQLPGYVFEDVATLTATAEVVVAATVESVSKGEPIAPGDSLYHRDVQVRVDEVFQGSDIPALVVVHQLGYTTQGTIQERDFPWLTPGDRGVFFYNEPSWFGLTTCERMSGSRCDLYYIRFDQDYGQIDNAFEQNQYQYIGCHEFGHTSSVGHRTTDAGAPSCMVNGSGNRYYDQHDVDAIDADY